MANNDKTKTDRKRFNIPFVGKIEKRIMGKKEKRQVASSEKVASSEVTATRTGVAPTVEVIEKKMVSPARVTGKPQISFDGLSHAAQHLVLLIQHYVDVQKIIVPNQYVSWDALVKINKKVDLIEKKKTVKDLCGIHHFSPTDLENVAKNVAEFIVEHQPQMVKD